jgi:hypothetical protein
MLAASPALATVPLPDGRAWEMVSPPQKGGGEIDGIDGVTPDGGPPGGGIVQAAENGNAIVYVSLFAFPGSNGKEPLGAPPASQYLSTRTPAGWSTENITPAASSGTYAPESGAPYEAFSSDLSLGLMQNGSSPPVEDPPLAGAPSRYQNYYIRDNPSGEFAEALLTTTPPEEPQEFHLELLGVTPDLKHAVVTTPAALTPEATRHEEHNLYEWDAAAPQPLQPINVLPSAGHSGQTAAGGALLGMGRDENHTIADDGSRVFWSQPSTESLFVRENVGTAQAETAQVDESRGGADPSGGGEFQTASSDGSKVFFTDGRRLTSTSTAGRSSAHEDLYLFDVDTEQLTDLTIDESDPHGASVLGVLGSSEDGSYVYFVAEGNLPGTGAIAGEDNLYVWHETAPGKGTTHFIAALSADDNGHSGLHEPGIAHDWAPSTGERTTRVSSDGANLVFMSERSLTGYDNTVNVGTSCGTAGEISLPAQCEEVFLYDASTNHLTCVSCNPSGARPLGPSGIPGGTPWRTVNELGTYQSRVLSTEGNRVFFDSRDALASQTANGAQNVYEWEQDGTGTCTLEGGCVFLLSGATGAGDSSFVDASANGDDVFFVTRANLVEGDTDQLQDLYDARVGGGFPAPASALPACEGESCMQPASPALLASSLASTTLSGVGNLTPASAPVLTATQTEKPKKDKPTKKPHKHSGKHGKTRGHKGRGLPKKARRSRRRGHA